MTTAGPSRVATTTAVVTMTAAAIMSAGPSRVAMTTAGLTMTVAVRARTIGAVGVMTIAIGSALVGHRRRHPAAPAGRARRVGN